MNPANLSRWLSPGSDRSIRSVLAALACVSGGLALYASFIPLRYQPMGWEETWERFLQIPWLQLGLEKRADWVGNGLVLIPFGFFLCGFLQWGRQGIIWKITGGLGFAAFHVFLVCFIEYVQIWFPPRVLSQNDMFAGYVGGLVGWGLWHCVGDRVVAIALQFLNAPRGIARLSIVAQCCAAGLFLFGLLPLDVMLTPAEWGKKAELDRFCFIPFTDWQGLRDVAKSIALCGWAAPLGIVLAVRYGERPARMHVLYWAVAIELASLPIYHRHTSSTDIVLAAAMGCLGVWVAKPVLSSLSRMDQASAWLLASLAWGVTLVFSFVAKADRWVTDQQEILDRLGGIIAVPFARAQRSSEFEAIENILLKLSVFALLGFLLTGWCSRGPSVDRGRFRMHWHVKFAVLWVMAVAIAIEVLQACLIPLVADATDLLLYGTGAAMGAISFLLLVPRWSMDAHAD